MHTTKKLGNDVYHTCFLNHQQVKSNIFEESHSLENIEPKSESGHRSNYSQRDRVVLFSIRVINNDEDYGKLSSFSF
jgi:hypothetical protein